MLCLISQRLAKYRNILQELTAQGIFCFGCRMEKAVELCRIKDVGGVVIDLTGFHNYGLTVLEKLRAAYPEMPIARLDAPDTDPVLQTYLIDRRPEDAKALTEALLHFCFDVCHFYPAKQLVTEELHYNTVTGKCLYRGYPLPLSRTQQRLVHALLYHYPRPVLCDDLLGFCGLDKKDRHKLYLQIACINRKAARISSEPFIKNVYAKGYRLTEAVGAPPERLTEYLKAQGLE